MRFGGESKHHGCGKQRWGHHNIRPDIRIKDHQSERAQGQYLQISFGEQQRQKIPGLRKRSRLQFNYPLGHELLEHQNEDVIPQSSSHSHSRSSRQPVAHLRKLRQNNKRIQSQRRWQNDIQPAGQ